MRRGVNNGPQLSGFGGLGGLPIRTRPPVRTSQPCGPGTLAGGDCPAAPDELPPLEGELAALVASLRRTMLHTQPSPLVSPPLEAKIPTLQERVVIAPPSSPGDSDGATAATKMAHAEGAIVGTDLTVLTPADTSDFVTVISHTVPRGQAMVVVGVGAWGHDYMASRDVIVWRLTGGDGVIAHERELGLVGSLDSPARVFGLVREGEQLVLECRNLDTKAPSLVQATVEAWQFPVQSNERTLSALLDRQADVGGCV